MGRDQRLGRTRQKNLTAQLDEHGVSVLLDRLCIRFGLCLAPAEIERLAHAHPASVDEFTEAVLVAEGYAAGLTKLDPMGAAVREEVARAFMNHIRPED